MIFNAIDRGVLEQLFDSDTQTMKVTVNLARDEMFHNILNDKDGVDLALGITIGIIHTSFINGFRLRNNRPLNTEETNELLRITQSKLGQLRELIFQCG